MYQSRSLIVHRQTVGLRHDALVLADALQNAIPKGDVYSLTLPPSILQDYSSALPLPREIAELVPFDRVFLLEHAHSNPPLLDYRFARQIVYIPNVEWISACDERVLQSARLDLVLLKNEFSRTVIAEIPGAESLRIELAGWTSIDVALSDSRMEEKDYGRFLHVRGVSHHKQTEVVAEAWRRHPEFPMLTIAVSGGSFELPHPLRYADNVIVHLKTFPDQELRRVQNASGVHVCPSRAEGFGHSLNEARASSAMLITTGGPPMNDFVIPGVNGFLVPVRPENTGRLGRSRFFEVDAADLADTVEQVLAMPIESRRRMGEQSRRLYLAGRERFLASVAELWG